MKTKLAVIEEKAAKLQAGWNASHASQKRSVLGATSDSSPSKSADRLRLPPPPRVGEAPDKVAILQRTLREKNGEIQDLQVTGRCPSPVLPPVHRIPFCPRLPLPPDAPTVPSSCLPLLLHSLMECVYALLQDRVVMLERQLEDVGDRDGASAAGHAELEEEVYTLDRHLKDKTAQITLLQVRCVRVCECLCMLYVCGYVCAVVVVGCVCACACACVRAPSPPL